MKSYLTLIKRYASLFLSILGLAYLTQELWNWFEGDSLFRIAVLGTIAVVISNLTTFLYSKHKSKTHESI